jgi:hypothetical protein
VRADDVSLHFTLLLSDSFLSLWENKFGLRFSSPVYAGGIFIFAFPPSLFLCASIFDKANYLVLPLKE